MAAKDDNVKEFFGSASGFFMSSLGAFAVLLAIGLPVKYETLDGQPCNYLDGGATSAYPDCPPFGFRSLNLLGMNTITDGKDTATVISALIGLALGGIAFLIAQSRSS